ncbi:MAG TPA: hypothetical protein DCM40_21305, partial [Maribacter sp.]|nr:hypothetical protein [Maribacter sp.]
MAKGSIENLTQTDSLFYNLNNISFKSNKTAIDKLISSKELGISVPKTIVAEGSLSGGTSWVKPNMVLKIPEGNANINALVDFGEIMKFDGTVSIDSLQLGQLLQNDQLGEISLQINANGSGNETSNLDANITGNISQFQYGGYSYKAIDIDGILNNGKGNISA